MNESDCGGKAEFACSERIVYVVSKIEQKREKKRSFHFWEAPLVRGVAELIDKHRGIR